MTTDSSKVVEDTHLDDAELLSYVRSELLSERIACVEAHILDCDACGDRLDAIANQSDSLSTQLRSLLALRAKVETLHGSDASDGSDLASSQSEARSSRQRFRKRKVVGRGGMGEIWMAHDALVNRRVALKQLRTDKAWSPKHLARFEREVMLTAKLSHPGTVYVIDYSDEPGDAWYAMNLVQGETLAELIGEYHAQRDSSSEASFTDFISLLNMFVSVCNTVAYAHSEGILHRDIKSDNVMVGRFGQVTLIDWGLAKSVSDANKIEPLGEQDDPATPASSRTTVEGQTIGTPAFMSPEQAVGDLGQIDFRSDTYALAAMLYEILTGKPPFGDQDVDAVIRHVILTIPKPARDLVPDCPATLEQVCVRGLAKEREQRFQTAEELAQSVQNWIAGRARRDSADQHLKRFFDLAFDVTGIVDFRKGLQNLNPAWRTSFGWDPDEITGRTHYEMIHPNDQVKAARALSRANKRKETQQVTVRLLCKDGAYKWSQWSLAPYVEEASVFIIGRLVDVDSGGELKAPGEVV